MADHRLTEPLEAAERFADGQVTPSRLETVREMAAVLCEGSGDIIADHGPMAVHSICLNAADWFTAAKSSAAVAAEAASDRGVDWDDAHSKEHEAQVALIRDIFGNPFRPISLAPAWFTSDVMALARGIYDKRAFDQVPILADALHGAGCDNDDVLNHCRGDGLHVRGCWVVDLVLGKA